MPLLSSGFLSFFSVERRVCVCVWPPDDSANNIPERNERSKSTCSAEM